MKVDKKGSKYYIDETHVTADEYFAFTQRLVQRMTSLRRLAYGTVGITVLVVLIFMLVNGWLDWVGDVLSTDLNIGWALAIAAVLLLARQQIRYYQARDKAPRVDFVASRLTGFGRGGVLESDSSDTPDKARSTRRLLGFGLKHRGGES